MALSRTNSDLLSDNAMERMAARELLRKKKADRDNIEKQVGQPLSYNLGREDYAKDNEMGENEGNRDNKNSDVSGQLRMLKQQKADALKQVATQVAKQAVSKVTKTAIKRGFIILVSALAPTLPFILIALVIIIIVSMFMTMSYWDVITMFCNFSLKALSAIKNLFISIIKI